MNGLDDARLEALYLADIRAEPWLMVNMVSTIDGATAVDGRSSSIGGRQDTVVFRALRSVADVILVAAATVRAEGYGAADLPAHLVRRRLDHGRRPQPQIAIVSTTLEFDLAPFGDRPPLVVTSERADAERLDSLDRGNNVIVCGSERVDLVGAVSALHARGLRTVLAEGGPSLNGQLAAADLVDELCLTIAPILAGGESPRILRGVEMDGRFALDRAVAGETELFTRWLRLR